MASKRSTRSLRLKLRSPRLAHHKIPAKLPSKLNSNASKNLGTKRKIMARPNEHLVDLGSNEVNLNDTKYLAKLPLGGPQEFFTAAKAYLHRHLSQDWQFIENTEPEFDAWKGYFADKGWKLKFMANERKV